MKTVHITQRISSLSSNGEEFSHLKIKTSGALDVNETRSSRNSSNYLSYSEDRRQSIRHSSAPLSPLSSQTVEGRSFDSIVQDEIFLNDIIAVPKSFHDFYSNTSHFVQQLLLILKPSSTGYSSHRDTKQSLKFITLIVESIQMMFKLCKGINVKGKCTSLILSKKRTLLLKSLANYLCCVRKGPGSTRIHFIQKFSNTFLESLHDFMILSSDNIHEEISVSTALHELHELMTKNLSAIANFSLNLPSVKYDHKMTPAMINEIRYIVGSIGKMFKLIDEVSDEKILPTKEFKEKRLTLFHELTVLVGLIKNSSRQDESLISQIFSTLDRIIEGVQDLLKITESIKQKEIDVDEKMFNLELEAELESAECLIQSICTDLKRKDGKTIMNSPQNFEYPSLQSTSISKMSSDADEESQKSRFSFYEEASDNKDIIISPNGRVNAGTFYKLVEFFTGADQKDETYIEQFLISYRLFATSHQLIAALKARFDVANHCDNNETQKAIRLRTLYLMKIWTENYSEEEDLDIIQDVRKYCLSTMIKYLESPTRSLLKIISRLKFPRKNNQFHKDSSSSQPIIGKASILTDKFNILHIDPLELARQLTIIDSNFFMDIKVAEFLQKSNRRSIKFMIQHSNNITSWISHQILMEKDEKNRGKIIVHFISVCKKLLSLNNYSTLMSILTSFSQCCIYRLSKTWKLIPEEYMVILEELRSAMSSTRNYAKYRKALSNSNPPLVPFIGCYMTDLTFIDSAIPDETPSGLINFSKFSKLALIIQHIQIYQRTPFNFEPFDLIHAAVMDGLKCLPDEEEMYQLSLLMEPRGR